jgi:hypothetical protein
MSVNELSKPSGAKLQVHYYITLQEKEDDASFSPVFPDIIHLRCALHHFHKQSSGCLQS